MTDYKALIAQNNHLWGIAEYHSDMLVAAKSVASHICASDAKAVYKKLQGLTSVPWWVIGVIHYRECSLKWTGSIAQGDPWNKVSTHDPRGRGPFKSFLAAGVDALMNCAPHAGRWKDWTPGGALTLLELYNGLGYETHGTPSPYVWSGTQNYRHGKFVADHQYSATAVDKQLGAAIILHCMQELDASVMIFGDGKGPNPDEYPDPEARPDVPADDTPSVEDTLKDKAKDKAKEIATDPSTLGKAKSLIKSKIAWLQGTAATAATGAVTSGDGVMDDFMHLLHKPQFWFVVIILACVGLTIFFRWKDHGKGAAK